MTINSIPLKEISSKSDSYKMSLYPLKLYLILKIRPFIIDFHNLEFVMLKVKCNLKITLFVLL